MLSAGVGVDVVVVGQAGRFLEVVRGQEAEQALADLDGVGVVLGDEVDHAGVHHVGIGAAERLGGDLLAGHLLDDLGPGDEHLGLAGHDDEVGQRRASRPRRRRTAHRSARSAAPRRKASTLVKKTRP